MHKATFLEGTLTFTIKPEGPILIKASDRGGGDPALPDMEFVRSRGQVFIPGSSLKGVIRAHCERICRSLDSTQEQDRRLARRRAQDSAEAELIAEQNRRFREATGIERRRETPADQRVPLADNPLGNGRSYEGLEDLRYSSGRYVESLREAIDEHPRKTALIYRRSSFVSQLFGHTSLAGRVRFADAYPQGEVTLEERNGVAIDRLYGSVAVGPFNYEVAVAGTFATRISFKNLTLAQLGLLSLALRDLAEGRVGIGFGKSRGLGRVEATYQELTIRYPTCLLAEDRSLVPIGGVAAIPAEQIVGVGALAGAAYSAYNFPTAADDTGVLPDLQYRSPAKAEEGLFAIADELFGVTLLARGKDAITAVWKACMPAWRKEIGLG